MPTGYTQFIENGEITEPKDFVKLCLMNFGVMSDVRDNKLSLETVNNYKIDLNNDFSYKYAKERIRELLDELNEFENLISSKKTSLLTTYIRNQEDTLKKYTEFINNAKKINDKYDLFIDTIKRWECSSEFENIKKFAIEQLECSKENTDYENDAIEKIKENIVNPTEAFEKYMKVKIEGIINDINYQLQELEKAIKRVTEKQAFYDNFMKEVEDIQYTNVKLDYE